MLQSIAVRGNKRYFDDLTGPYCGGLGKNSGRKFCIWHFSPTYNAQPPYLQSAGDHERTTGRV
jgi:hypothetical protein